MAILAPWLWHPSNAINKSFISEWCPLLVVRIFYCKRRWLAFMWEYYLQLDSRVYQNWDILHHRQITTAQVQSAEKRCNFLWTNAAVDSWKRVLITSYRFRYSKINQHCLMCVYMAKYYCWSVAGSVAAFQATKQWKSYTNIRFTY